MVYQLTPTLNTIEELIMQFWFYILVLCKKLCQQCLVDAHLPFFPSSFLLPFSPFSVCCAPILFSIAFYQLDSDFTVELLILKTKFLPTCFIISSILKQFKLFSSNSLELVYFYFLPRYFKISRQCCGTPRCFF